MENTAWKDSLEKAKKHFQIADHMAYVTLTLLKDNRLIIKILSETAEATGYIVKAILQKALVQGKIQVTQDPESNFKIFADKLGPKYIDKKDMENISKIMEIRRKHINAPVEFVRNNKFVILLEDKYETLTIEYLKELMGSARKLLNKAVVNL